ncbi:NmrA family transcriptional regulator [Sphaerisporangium melleum]|uniref:NmrA family transcriptional regulator n=1 Tax=Sphaerisporangium melleum TaxID=321316 RepID=A0A917QQL6_9ACTN|nr:NAD(P)H-binding protein [Sphaerisporangium melleum]GGK63507.1 NmrA family transcriptional regulator [Sphaerisporangium melleum]GII68096.1 NmrA family transcriptional regulator [Sphaerisporangium melleum]
MIVVTGATGNVGRDVVRILAEAGEQVTAVSRQSVQPSELPPGVRHVRGDLAEPVSLRPALEGADALFLLVAGDDPQGILDLATAAGVRRVVLLSSQGARTRPDVYRHPAAFEDAVRGSVLAWTILRPGGFASNAFAWAEQIRSQRTAAAPFGDVGLPAIDPADIAEVAAATLTKDGHTGRAYELTGPQPVTPRERAAAIGAALGTPVRFVEQTREEARAQMLRFMPEPVVDGTLAILGEPSDDERKVSPDVERILGRAPRTFADWAARNIAAFR